MSQGNGLIALPLLVQLGVFDEDEEVVVGALVVDLGLLSLAANHFDCGMGVVGGRWCGDGV